MSDVGVGFCCLSRISYHYFIRRRRLLRGLCRLLSCFGAYFMLSAALRLSGSVFISSITSRKIFNVVSLGRRPYTVMAIPPIYHRYSVRPVNAGTRPSRFSPSGRLRFSNKARSQETEYHDRLMSHGTGSSNSGNGSVVHPQTLVL